MKTKYLAIFLAILAAFCYGISAPVSKVLLVDLHPTLMASLLYLGAGIGMLILSLTGKKRKQREAPLTKNELPYVIAMVVLDIAAPILLMFGLTMTTSATASLLNNFEIVVTSVIALVIFKESVGRRMWVAIFFITIASAILSLENPQDISLSSGALFVLLACLCWGLENNCTRMLSLKDPQQIVIIKGFGSGVGSFIIALALGVRISRWDYVFYALLLGFVAYGLSIYFYILAQRSLGAARTSAYYAFAPFIGVALSLAIFTEPVPIHFWIALIIMLVGTYFAAFEKHSHRHIHEQFEHEHRHSHNDEHHLHEHEPAFTGEHSHLHVHKKIEHAHSHTPDLHHTHPLRLRARN